MASHIMLPPDDSDDDEEQRRLEDEEADDCLPSPAASNSNSNRPFSAMCVRISRDSYPNLRALRNASTASLADAAYIKISEGDFGYVLDDVPHLADYLPDVTVSTRNPPRCSIAGFTLLRPDCGCGVGAIVSVPTGVARLLSDCEQLE